MMYETFEETVNPAHTALLVTDVQNDFCKDKSRQAMIPYIARVLEAGRKSGVLVVYIQNTVLPDSLSDAPSDVMRRRKLGINTDVTIEGTWGHQIVDQLKPGPKEPIVRKHRLSAFIGTTLDIMLRSKAIQTVVVTGTATHGCVINTATEPSRITTTWWWWRTALRRGARTYMSLRSFSCATPSTT